MLRWTEKETGEKLVDVVGSLNEQAQKLYQQEVATASYSDVKPTLDNFDQIGLAIEEVEKAIHSTPGHEGRYMRSMVNAFRYFARSLQGDKVGYDELLLNIQELPSTLITDDSISAMKERVEKGLKDFGYTGTLREMGEAWRKDTLIEPEVVTTVAEKFMERSKHGTLERVIGLPEEDGIDSIKSIRNVFWSGYSKYTGNYRGNLTFNIDRPWSEPILAQIMTHEAYPGHQAFYCRWDYLFKQGKLPLEASYYLINSPTNALFEGGPETALHFLGWDVLEEETPGVSLESKKQYILARDYLDLQRMYQTNACYMYNLGHSSKEEVLDYMMNQGSMNSVEAGNSFTFFSDPIQRTYYPAYYYGRWMVGLAYDATPVEKRQDYFKILYDTPHTTVTFIDAISHLIGTEFVPFVVRPEKVEK
ncbi:hypothetical protein SM124_06160 [Bacillus sp. 31A1R]|uniref:DUF885 domain-containing protein n=1 Tax=Robertmurraya mangrovi TaxID=3098077 RepID=A0ABU5IW01_9BACI|nr:hypothetical protein [Bacillus sp. 31A1R]MDZ5471327.1 hypothetical protein [Bacillus sp. 31A1R]